ncbi:hypothetical protein [Paraburkholderia diazotrophica]|uniref:hypothetical protein n=1 Tax=Paraburkholderia diazotrophica TaxID=667676 RepID=UPI00317D4205
MIDIQTAADGVGLLETARQVIGREGWHADAARVLDPPWQIFARFVLGLGAAPASVTDVPVETLEAFSRHCDLEGAVAFEEAPLILGAVRLILLHCGYDREALAALSAPRRRKRVQNKDKAYRHEVTRPREVPGKTGTQAGGDSDTCGEEKTS